MTINRAWLIAIIAAVVTIASIFLAQLAINNAHTQLAVALTARYEAWGDRETAIAKNTASEFELAKTRATAAFYRQNYAEAVEYYTQALIFDPGSVVLYNSRGTMYSLQQQFDRAIADYDQAISLEPDDWLAYQNRGKAYLATGDLDAALADFSRVIELNPDYAEAYFWRGEAYMQQQNWYAAEADLNRAVEIEPEYNDTYYVKRGELAYAIGDFRAASTNFGFALRQNVHNMNAQFLQVLANLRQGKMPSRVSDYMVAVAPLVYDETAARVALTAFDEAIASEPENPLLVMFRGYLYYARGDVDQAAADWSQAEALGGTLPPEFLAPYQQIQAR